MSHKIHPYGFRLGYIKPHKSVWIALKAWQYREWVKEDFEARDFIRKFLRKANVVDIWITKDAKRVDVVIEVGKVGVAVGPKGQNVEVIRRQLQKIFGKDRQVNVQIKGIKNPNASAAVVAQNIAFGIEKRRSVKALVKRAIEAIRKTGVLGAKIIVSGRIGGADQALKYKRQFGRVPLHTLRADIDYAYERAFTSNAGVLSVKVWIYKGDVFEQR